MNRKGRPFGKLVDSGRRTIAFVQVARKHAVPWSKPADFDNDQPDLLARLAGDSRGFFAGLADKRIIYLPKTIDVDALKNAMRAELDASEQQFNDRAQLYAVFTDIASNDKMEDANYDPVSELPLYLFEDLIARFAIVGAL